MTQVEAIKPRVVHIITGLDTGGAEMMLYKLLQALSKEEVESAVISLMSPGPIAEKIDSLGIKVHSLELKQGGLPGFRELYKLMALVRDFKPTVIQGWMYHGNLAALIASFIMLRKMRLIWNIRQTIYSLPNEKKVTRWLIKLGALLSRVPDQIIYNSYVSVEQHEQLGFHQRHRVVVFNGFDVQQFRPDDEAKQSVREELALPNGAVLIGKISRFHPMKDHATLLQAASLVLKQKHDAYFLFAGREMTTENMELASLIDSMGLGRHVFLMGERTDVPRLMAALDVSVSSSAWGEGFPNAVGEAMACGVPCVVTDVGDSARVVADWGRVISAKNPEAMASSIIALLTLGDGDKEHLATMARERVRKNFSLDAIAQNYLELYR